MATRSRAVRVEAVLLDAYGTLVTLDDPAGDLAALLAREGFPHPRARVEAALAAEIRHYRAHHDLGRDRESLASLRLMCAGVLADGLGDDVPPLPRLTELLVDALRFRPFPDAEPALDALAARGLRVGVVSNWDCGLHEVLAGLGLGARVHAVVTSAETGAAKPAPEIFRRALELLGARPEAAVHCGDRPREDCEGARAAGIRAVLLDRDGGPGEGPCPRIRTLQDLPAAVAA